MKPNNYFSTINIKLYGGLLFSSLFFCASQAQAYYICPANFYYAAGAGCVPTYNNYSNVITVSPGYNYG